MIREALEFFEDHMKKSGIREQSSAQCDAIDAVMFYIWATGYLKQGHVKATLTTLLGMLVGLILSIVFLPITLFRLLPAVIISFLVAHLAYLALQPTMPIISTAAIFILSLLVIRFKKFKEIISNLIFNIADVISLSRLTRAYIRRYLALDRIKEMNDKERKVFLTATRILDSNDPHQRESDALQQVVSHLSDNQDELSKEIEKYWRVGRDDLTYWQDRIAKVRATPRCH